MPWSQIFAFLKEESPLFSMIITGILLIILILPGIVDVNDPTWADVLKARREYIVYIAGLFVLTLSLGLCRYITRYFKSRQAKRAQEAERELKANTLSHLLGLEREGARFASQDECVHWANRVAPLLRFNGRIYEEFKQFQRLIPLGLSVATTAPAVESMRAQVNAAIEELKHDLGIIDDNK